mmetsp:Transcript_56234/g.131039  ORF Transcript_56234/g.131039 Transcript_56234/m.131039 type:complete len:259 (-) Transcript_56234:64-840(-)
MPFVPLGSRKRIEVILDDDKERLAAAQQTKDTATISAHSGLAPSAQGYRFGNHPLTRGRVRPDVPFTGATSSWRPPSADREGPSSQKDREQTGSAIWYESHRMKQTLSSPALSSTNMTVPLATHPLTKEIERWERLSTLTQAREMTRELRDELREEKPVRSKSSKPEFQPKPGLVNFPKYMLINDCHLKRMEQQRFQREDQNASLSGSPVSSKGPESAVMYGAASWASPVLRQKGTHWAGHGLAAGRMQRTSNPFRTG